MKVRDITAVIEAFAPLSLQESYDNSGLIVGRADDEVHKALLAVDVTEEVLAEAVAEGCDMVITNGACPENLRYPSGRALRGARLRAFGRGGRRSAFDDLRMGIYLRPADGNSAGNTGKISGTNPAGQRNHESLKRGDLLLPFLVFI